MSRVIKLPACCVLKSLYKCVFLFFFINCGDCISVALVGQFLKPNTIVYFKRDQFHVKSDKTHVLKLTPPSFKCIDFIHMSISFQFHFVMKQAKC